MLEKITMGLGGGARAPCAPLLDPPLGGGRRGYFRTFSKHSSALCRSQFASYLWKKTNRMDLDENFSGDVPLFVDEEVLVNFGSIRILIGIRTSDQSGSGRSVLCPSALV